MKKITVGSRESVLAVVQANMLIDCLKAAHPELDIELVTMKTTGDKILDRTLDKVGGKGLFVKELDAALLERRADLTVHSLKDMPMEVSAELPLLCFSKREDPRDALVLAAAGPKRLGLESRIARYFTTEEIIPAAGQGILGVQGRRGEDHAFLDCFADAEGAYAALCERAFVRELDGGCTSPVCAHAVVEGKRITLRGLYYDPATGAHRVGTDEGGVDEAEALGARLARRLRG